MAIAFVQASTGVAGSGTSLNASFGSNVTAGNLLLVQCSNGGFVTTVTDTLGNTYNVDVEGTDPNDGSARVALASTITSAGGADTVTCTELGGGTIRINLYEYSGVASSGALDQTNNSSGTGTSISAGSVVPSTDGQLIFAVVRNSSGVTFTAGTDFTIRGTTLAGAGTQRQAGEEYIQPTAASHGATFTQSASVSWGAAVATYKAAGGGGFTPFPGNSNQLLQMLGVGT